MKTTTTTTPRLLSLLLTMATVFCLAAFTACSENNDDEPENPVTPETPTTPTNPDDWQTVPASGGTVSRGDITITFPSGTFATETKVAVTEVKKGTVMGSDERSTFYQITLAANTSKAFTVRLKSENTDAQTLIVQRVQGLNQHTGETENGILPMVETTAQGGEYTVSIPTLHAEDGEQPSLTIGLAEVLTSDNAEASARQTRASTDKGVVVSWPGLGSAEKKLIVAEAKKYAEEANQVLVAFGLQRPDITIPYVIEPGKGWGNHIQSKLTDSNNYIQLCKQNFEGLLNASETDLQELRRTVLHETFHYYFSQVYDKRWASTKTAAGLMGDEWTLLNEAFGGWIEKQVAPYEMFEEAANQGRLLMEEFFPKSLNMDRSILQGYGMGLALEYFAQQKSDKKLLELLNIKRDESPSSLRACFDKFLSKNGMTFFDDASYYKFVEAALDGKIDKRTPYLPASGGGKNLPFNINKAGGDLRRMSLHQVVSYSDTVNNLGIYPMQIAFTDGDIVMLGTEKQLKVTEEADGVETHVYICDPEFKNRLMIKPNLQHLGVAKKDAPLTYKGDFSMFKTNADACFYLVSFKLNSSTYSVQTNTSIVLTYDDYINLESDELTFDGKGGSQTVTVDTNLDDLTVEPSDHSWLSATYDKAGSKLTVTAGANTGDKREGTITVKGGELTATIKVTQQAGEDSNYWKLVGSSVDNSKAHSDRGVYIADVSGGNGSYSYKCTWTDGPRQWSGLDHDDCTGESWTSTLSCGQPQEKYKPGDRITLHVSWTHTDCANHPFGAAPMTAGYYFYYGSSYGSFHDAPGSEDFQNTSKLQGQGPESNGGYPTSGSGYVESDPLPTGRAGMKLTIEETPDCTYSRIKTIYEYEWVP